MNKTTFSKILTTLICFCGGFLVLGEFVGQALLDVMSAEVLGSIIIGNYILLTISVVLNMILCVRSGNWYHHKASTKTVIVGWLGIFVGQVLYFVCLFFHDETVQQQVFLFPIILWLAGFCTLLIGLLFKAPINKAFDRETKFNAKKEEARKEEEFLAEKHAYAEKKRKEAIEQVAKEKKAKRQAAKAEAEAKRQAAEAEAVRMDTEASLDALNFSTYDLARIVQFIIKDMDFSEDRETLSVLRKNYNLLNEAVEDICKSYYYEFEDAIKGSLESSDVSVNFSIEVVYERLEELVQTCISLSRDLVIEKLEIEIINTDIPQSSVIAETRKWSE